MLNYLTFCLRRVGGDGVEDVDKHEEERDQESHPPRDDVRRNHEAGKRSDSVRAKKSFQG